MKILRLVGWLLQILRAQHLIDAFNDDTVILAHPVLGERRPGNAPVERFSRERAEPRGKPLSDWNHWPGKRSSLFVPVDTCKPPKG